MATDRSKTSRIDLSTAYIRYHVRETQGLFQTVIFRDEIFSLTIGFGRNVTPYWLWRLYWMMFFFRMRICVVLHLRILMTLGSMKIFFEKPGLQAWRTSCQYFREGEDKLLCKQANEIPVVSNPVTKRYFFFGWYMLEHLPVYGRLQLANAF